MEQRQEVRHNALYLIRDEDLVAIELDLVALQVEIAVDAREVEDTRQMEREVDVEVNPEQRLVLHRIERTVEVLIVLVFQCRRCLGPQRFHAVDDVVVLRLHFLAILPFCLLAKGDRHCHELAVLIQQSRDARLLKEFLAIVSDVQHNVGTAVSLLSLLKRELWRTVASPVHGLGTLLIALGDDLDLVRHHKAGVEAESEVSDDGIGLILVFRQEVSDT